MRSNETFLSYLKHRHNIVFGPETSKDTRFDICRHVYVVRPIINPNVPPLSACVCSPPTGTQKYVPGSSPCSHQLLTCCWELSVFVYCWFLELKVADLLRLQTAEQNNKTELLDTIKLEAAVWWSLCGLINIGDTWNIILWFIVHIKMFHV